MPVDDLNNADGASIESTPVTSDTPAVLKKEPLDAVQVTMTLPPGTVFPFLQPQPSKVQNPPIGSLIDPLAINNLVTYVAGVFLYFPYYASLYFSCVMLYRGYFHTTARYAFVLALTVIELMACLFAGAFSWMVFSNCYTAYDDENHAWCAPKRVGMVSIAIFMLGFLIGILRQVVTWRASQRILQARYSGLQL